MKQVKKCSKCNEEKTTDCFKIRSDTGKLNSRCIECMRKHRQNYEEKNKERIAYRHKKHRKNNYIECLERERASRKRNREQRSAYDKKYSENNKERCKAYAKQYREKHRDIISKKAKAKYIKNQNDIREKNRKKYAENHRHSRYVKNSYHKKRMASDIQYRLRRNVRTRLKTVLGGNIKGKLKYIGCSFVELKTHLESKFTNNMSWENYGEWHIDHIIPLASFDLQNEDERLKACHYTNLQPLWAKDNLSKGAKISKEFGNAT